MNRSKLNALKRLLEAVAKKLDPDDVCPTCSSQPLIVETVVWHAMPDGPAPPPTVPPPDPPKCQWPRRCQGGAALIVVELHRVWRGDESFADVASDGFGDGPEPDRTAIPAIPAARPEPDRGPSGLPAQPAEFEVY